MSSQVQSFYKNIIEEVIAKCTPSFLDCGFEESTIRELQTLWEQKLQNSGSTSTGIFDRGFESDLSKYTMQLQHNLPSMMGTTGMGVTGIGFPSFYGKPPTFLPNTATGPINPMMMYSQQSTTPILQNLNQQYFAPGLSDRAMAVPVPGGTPLRLAQQPTLVSRDQLVSTNTDMAQLASTLNAQYHQQPQQQQQQRQTHHDPLGQVVTNQRLEESTLRVTPSSGLQSLGLLNQTQQTFHPTPAPLGKTSVPPTTVPPAITPIIPSTVPSLVTNIPPSSSTIPKITIPATIKPPPPTLTPASSGTATSATKKTGGKSDWTNLKQQMNMKFKKTDEIRKTQQQQANSENQIQQQQQQAAAAAQQQQLQLQQLQRQQQQQQQAAAAGGSDGSDDEEIGDEELNSRDDESDDSAEPETDNLVVCTFDKVSRVKNKWKISLKCGVMNLNGKDYLFNRATGEGEW